MAICITELCNGGIFSFYLGFLIAIHHFKALVLHYKINSVDRVKLKSFSHKQMICSRGSNFPTLQKIHSGRLGGLNPRRHGGQLNAKLGFLPSTRTISAVLPPSSETGSTCATRVVSFFSSSTTPLNAVPPAAAFNQSRFTKKLY